MKKVEMIFAALSFPILPSSRNLANRCTQLCEDVAGHSAFSSAQLKNRNITPHLDFHWQNVNLPDSIKKLFGQF